MTPGPSFEAAPVVLDTSDSTADWGIAARG